MAELTSDRAVILSGRDRFLGAHGDLRAQLRV